MAFPVWLTTLAAGVPAAVSSIASLFSRAPKPREPAPPAGRFDATDAEVDAALAKRRAAEEAEAPPAVTRIAPVAANGTGARTVTLTPPKP